MMVTGPLGPGDRERSSRDAPMQLEVTRRRCLGSAESGQFSIVAAVSPDAPVNWARTRLAADGGTIERCRQLTGCSVSRS